MQSTVTFLKKRRLFSITSIIKINYYENFKQQSIIKYINRNKNLHLEPKKTV